MAEFITYAEPGSYEIDFKTMDYSEYREIEEAARVHGIELEQLLEALNR